MTTATIVGDTAHEIVGKTIDHIMEYGRDVEAWGGTIPENLGGDGPNDRDREVREVTEGFSFVLTNPRARWSEWGAKRSQWVGITLRETEDDLFALNPGMTPLYSSVYQEWLEETDAGEKLPHTYGERMQKFGQSWTGESHITDFVDQWDAVVDLLSRKPHTRKASMSFWDPHVDARRMHDEDNAYLPCNVFFQTRVVDGDLEWHTFSRSKDALLGIPENIFMFTVLQELMVLELRNRGLDVGLGRYVSHSSNVHLYSDHIENGYHRDEPTDPYAERDPMKIGVRPWGTVDATFARIDEHLQDGNFMEAVDKVFEIDDRWWRSWKAALVAEWIRMNSDDEELVMGMFNEIDAVWDVSVAKRAARTFESEYWKNHAE